ncbi:MAG TPA: glycosyltransferase [Planctomycetota bacterium]|nr:glycosyltransferase [Planctomycetota bacterium]
MSAVTFAIPCRDAGPWLRPLLESLLAQSRQDFVLLLVDDRSRDGSVALAREVAGTRVLIHENETPRGIGGNWNRCVELAATPFVCLAHQDDVYEPTYLERMLEALQARPDAGLAHCRATAVDAAGVPFASPAERFKDHFWKHEPGEDRAAHYARLWRGNFVCCPSVLYRTDAVRAAGPFRADLRFALDWEFWFRMLRRGFGIVDVAEPLVRYRRHAAQASSEATADHSRFEEELQVLEEARAAGASAGLLSAVIGTSPALRNNLLHEAFTDLRAGRRQAVAKKLAFVRERAPALWRDPYVRVFRSLWRCGAPGRFALGLGRQFAVHLGLGGVA